ncbi:MAG: ImmA/IrrE family metallo-endopeptidase [Candidatus Freyarchaeota archaeon]
MADAEGEAEEAISHALIVEGPESSAKFKELRDSIRALRKKLQKENVQPNEGLAEIRKIRRQFESANPEYDVSKCQACGPVPDELEKLVQKLKQPSPRDLEDEMAQRFLNSLAEKHGVPPPKLEVVDSCNRPDMGLYTGGTIKVCRGNVSQHVLAHEFAHYLQHREGKPLDEAEAERFALQEIRGKTLYSPTAKYDGSERNMKTLKDVAVVYGADHIGQGILRALDWLDTQYPGIVFGQDPSLVVDLVATLGGIWGALNLRDPYDMLAALLGGYISTDLWRQAEKIAAPAARFVPAPTVTQTKTFKKTTVTSETTPLGTAPLATYVVTG